MKGEVQSMKRFPSPRAKFQAYLLPAPWEARAFYRCIADLLKHPKVRQMAQYVQHGDTTCLEHCLHVAYLTYRFCRRHGLAYRAATRAALLHDFFLYDWHTHHQLTGERFHGFHHPATALQNALMEFVLTPMQQDIIRKHMWPLTLVPPRYKEAYVVMWMDKYAALLETLDRLSNR